MKILLLLFFISLASIVCGQKSAGKSKQQNNDFGKIFINPMIYIDKDTTVIRREDIYHPHLFESLTEQECDSLAKLIHARKQGYPGDSVTVTEHFHIWKPLIDRLHYEDPHYWMWPLVVLTDSKFTSNDLQVIPVNLLLINDTVIVDKTLDTVFHMGDRILAINNEPIENFMNFPQMRYIPCPLLQQFHHFAYSPRYVVDIERDGKRMQVRTNGMGYNDALFTLNISPFKRELLEKDRIGYIEIDAFFPNNSLLIKRLANFIKKAQKAGYKDVIIDVRKNPGGSGHNFDHLISLFTTQDTLNYAWEEKVRVSEYTLDYGFPKDSIGRLADIPAKEAHPKLPLKPKKYAGDMNYYILMSRNTQSMAATFVNILQTNGLAKLCGEPLMHNALKYGETIQMGWGSKSNIEVFSTVLTKEYTKSPDGQIYPDIPIQYIAQEYLKGGDPVLEKLINYIKQHR